MRSVVYVSCQLSADDGDKIEDLVASGAYLNRSDLIRTAIRELLKNADV